MTGKRYLSRKQEAERVGFSERTLERHCKAGVYPHIVVGGRVLFDPDLSDEYLANLVRNGPNSELTKP